MTVLEGWQPLASGPAFG